MGRGTEFRARAKVLAFAHPIRLPFLLRLGKCRSTRPADATSAPKARELGRFDDGISTKEPHARGVGAKMTGVDARQAALPARHAVALLKGQLSHRRDAKSFADRKSVV